QQMPCSVAATRIDPSEHSPTAKRIDSLLAPSRDVVRIMFSTLQKVSVKTSNEQHRSQLRSNMKPPRMNFPQVVTPECFNRGSNPKFACFPAKRATNHDRCSLCRPIRLLKHHNRSNVKSPLSN